MYSLGVQAGEKTQSAKSIKLRSRSVATTRRGHDVGWPSSHARRRAAHWCQGSGVRESYLRRLLKDILQGDSRDTVVAAGETTTERGGGGATGQGGGSWRRWMGRIGGGGITVEVTGAL